MTSARHVYQDDLVSVADGFSSVPSVIPSTIPAESIQVVGPWHNFNITWSSSSEVNYGTVFYDVSVTVDGATYTAVEQVV